MTGFDMSGWIPQWASARDQLNRQRLNLRALHGHRIVDSWLVWDLQHDAWFADLPVVLLFDHGRQLEVSWQKFDDLSITWNTIDTTTTPIAWVDWPLTWRPQGHAALRAITGRTVTSTAATEHRFATRQIEPPTNDENSTWLVGGVWLGTGARGLHIFNALDENGLSSEVPGDGADNRRLEI